MQPPGRDMPPLTMFRWMALAVFLGALTVSAYHRRRARAQSETIARREGGTLIAARALVSLPLFGGPFLYVINPTGWHGRRSSAARGCDGLVSPRVVGAVLGALGATQPRAECQRNRLHQSSTTSSSHPDRTGGSVIRSIRPVSRCSSRSVSSQPTGLSCCALRWRWSRSGWR